ncbi:uncharacterized protein LOC131217364 [Magnolia sinica]|uniref:uncharacterized protein LOC131217364 n=1 Tax=Magnolia sinica TaxID=86752 RepID=UPI00265ACBC0|nr:uncharacterized protein LOC131217364 [Magnolia sinica]
MKKTNAVLKAWNKDVFGNIFSNIKQVEESMNLRARNKWIQEGDKNTKYFHSIANEKRRKAFISEIESQNGDRITDQAEMKEEVILFFSKLFSTETIDPLGDFISPIPEAVSPEDNSALLVETTIEEVKRAVADILVDGALSPDEFSGTFFSSSWEIVGQDLLNAVMFLFNGVRLNLLLPKLISREQLTFVQGRSISESIALAQELLHEINKKVRESNNIMKIDFEKAYDRVDWAFLKSVLQQFGFSYQWINLV